MIASDLIFTKPELFKKGGKEWGNQDLNLGPTDYESAALTAELLPRLFVG